MPWHSTNHRMWQTGAGRKALTGNGAVPRTARRNPGAAACDGTLLESVDRGACTLGTHVLPSFCLGGLASADAALVR
jgi:hypothetical protein